MAIGQRGHVGAEDDFVGAAVQEVGHGGAGFGDHGVGAAAGGVGSAGVGVVAAQVVGDGVDHALRDLRSAGAVEEAAGWPLTVWAREGNWARTWVRSRAVDCSVVSMVVTVIRLASARSSSAEIFGCTAALSLDRLHDENAGHSGTGVTGQASNAQTSSAILRWPRYFGMTGLNVSTGHRTHEICEHAVGCRVEAGIFFGDGEAGEDVGFEIDVRRRAGDAGHRLSAANFFGADAGFDSRSRCGARGRRV